MTIHTHATKPRPALSWARLLETRRDLPALDATWSLGDPTPRLSPGATNG